MHLAVMALDFGKMLPADMASGSAPGWQCGCPSLAGLRASVMPCTMQAHVHGLGGLGPAPAAAVPPPFFAVASALSFNMVHGSKGSSS